MACIGEPRVTDKVTASAHPRSQEKNGGRNPSQQAGTRETDTYPSAMLISYNVPLLALLLLPILAQVFPDVSGKQSSMYCVLVVLRGSASADVPLGGLSFRIGKAPSFQLRGEHTRVRH